MKGRISEVQSAPYSNGATQHYWTNSTERRFRKSLHLSSEGDIALLQIATIKNIRH